MKLHINGEERAFPDPVPMSRFTLATLVDTLNMKSDRVAIELNREIAPRDRWPEIVLQDGDHLEIVHFVGGGSEHVGVALKGAA
ncbi:MAG: sulfur carrier protein ThiS [Candidatus Sulfotelmatobacter sp.]